MSIVDRRQNPTGRNLGNRQRFLDRAKNRLRQAVKDNIRNRSIEDTTSNEQVVIPADDIQEPVFQRDAATGRRSGVLPGNREYRTGDTIPRPEGEGGGGGSQASEEGEGEDSFAFTLSRDEFLDLLFEDLALPDMLAKKLKSVETTRTRRAGFTTAGPATRLNMLRSLRRSLACSQLARQRWICSGYSPRLRQYSPISASLSAAVSMTALSLSAELQPSGSALPSGNNRPSERAFWRH